MENDIRLLEDLVKRAAESLKRLSAENGRLEDELRDVRGRLAEHERKDADVRHQGLSEQAWQTQRSQVVVALRETLSELRGE